MNTVISVSIVDKFISNGEKKRGKTWNIPVNTFRQAF